MGKYRGTRWPMEGAFVRIDEFQRLTYDARSWTEAEEATRTIHHTNDLTLDTDGDKTVVTLRVSTTEIGPKATLAAFGMKWGYKSQLDALERYLAGVQLQFFRGTSLDPVPPKASKHKEVRYLDIHEDDDMDEDQLVSWIQQASNLPVERM